MAHNPLAGKKTPDRTVLIHGDPVAFLPLHKHHTDDMRDDFPGLLEMVLEGEGGDAQTAQKMPGWKGLCTRALALAIGMKPDADGRKGCVDDETGVILDPDTFAEIRQTIADTSPSEWNGAFFAVLYMTYPFALRNFERELAAEIAAKVGALPVDKADQIPAALAAVPSSPPANRQARKATAARARKTKPASSNP